MIPEQMSVADFAARRAKGEVLTLLDVREEYELAAARLPFDVLHVPMAQVPARLAEIPRDRPVVVMCHGGYRSDRVAQFLRANGYAEIANLSGGIDEYAKRIDPSVPTY